MTILLLFIFFILLPFAPVFVIWFDGKIIHIGHVALYEVAAVKRKVEHRVFVRLPFKIFLPKLTTLMR